MGYLKAVLKAVLMNQSVQNVFYYHDQNLEFATLNDIEAFITQFNNTVLSALRPVQTTSLSYLMLDVHNVLLPDGPRSQFQYSSLNGSAAGEYLPPFFTAYMRGAGETFFTRPARKSFSGVVETAVSPGGAMAANFVPLYENLASALEANLDIGDGKIYRPYILRLATGETGVEVIARANRIVSWRWVGWSTQNSRKVGRGI